MVLQKKKSYYILYILESDLIGQNENIYSAFNFFGRHFPVRNDEDMIFLFINRYIDRCCITYLKRCCS